MTAHVLYPALDRKYPATFSPKILSGLLRKQLRFRGTVFSDALEMKAVTGRFGVGAAAVRAVNAGCDVVLVCRGEKDQEEANRWYRMAGFDQEEAVEAIARASADDREFRKAVSASTRRVSRLRKLLSRAGCSPPLPRASLRQVGSRKHRELSRLLHDHWQNSGQASRDGISGSIGED